MVIDHQLVQDLLNVTYVKIKYQINAQNVKEQDI
jgi:hypothetical protein